MQRTLAPDPRPEAGSFYRSDHFPFSKAGVPAVSFGSGEDLVNGGKEGGRALREEFTAKNYHQPNDEWSESLDFTGTANDVALITTSGAHSQTRGSGPSGRAAASSRPCATSRAASGSEPRAASRSGTAPADDPRRARWPQLLHSGCIEAGSVPDASPSTGRLSINSFIDWARS
jgi:hypothetical protein